MSADVETFSQMNAEIYSVNANDQYSRRLARPVKQNSS